MRVKYKPFQHRRFMAVRISKNALFSMSSFVGNRRLGFKIIAQSRYHNNGKDSAPHARSARKIDQTMFCKTICAAALARALSANESRFLPKKAANHSAGQLCRQPKPICGPFAGRVNGAGHFGRSRGHPIGSSKHLLTSFFLLERSY